MYGEKRPSPLKSKHTFLPGTKSIVGPPVTSTATTPASYQANKKLEMI